MLMVPYMREYVPWYHDWIQTRRCWRPPCRSPFHKSFEVHRSWTLGLLKYTQGAQAG
ncbi:hypothetical protein BDA96_04G145000 [Sorghum bicolor]|uniref:Uncharacterized protein n=1 Tax=Sorghum bicolor TaxID=4558 RepID=A0A921R5C5_SORBI|nr:hypothetical protein BDA96_04G145000 [Sorghum bicolor]